MGRAVDPAMEPRTPVHSFGRFTFDPRTGELLNAGRPVPLGPQPARALAYLIDRRGELVSRADLVRHLWGDGLTVVFDDGLNFCIRQIRVALGESAREGRYLQTLPRRGYRFVADPAVAAAHTTRPARRPWPDVTAATAACVLWALLLIGVPSHGVQGGAGGHEARFVPLSSVARQADRIVTFTLDAVEAHLSGRACAWRDVFHPPV